MTTTQDNIYHFPKNKIVREVPPNVEELEKTKERGKINYAEDVLANIMDNTLYGLSNNGIEIDIETSKDYAFLIDVLRVTIYRNLGIEHPLHAFINSSIEIVTENPALKRLEKNEPVQESGNNDNNTVDKTD